MSEYWSDYNGKFTTGYDSNDIDKCFDSIKMSMQDLEKRNKYLQEENKKLKDEHYKDEEILKLQQELQEVRENKYRGFEITKEEKEKIDKWTNEHKSNSGCIGGQYTYEFIPTSIGTIGTIKCGNEEFEFCSL